MNRFSFDVIKHILTFVDDITEIICKRVNRKYKSVIDNNIRYKYNKVKHEWLNDINCKVLGEHSSDLDIVERKNGDFVFFILDLGGKDTKDSIDELMGVIYDNSKTFAAAGALFNWNILESRLCPTHADDYDLEVFEKILNHKLIVKPCRLYHTDKIDVYAVQLYYYPYLTTNVEYHNDDSCSYRYIDIDGMRLLLDFQKYLTCSHIDMIKGNSMWMMKKFINEIEEFRSADKTELYYKHIIPDDSIIDDNWSLDRLDRLMQNLIDKKENEGKKELEFKKKEEDSKRNIEFLNNQIDYDGASTSNMLLDVDLEKIQNSCVTRMDVRNKVVRHKPSKNKDIEDYSQLSYDDA